MKMGSDTCHRHTKVGRIDKGSYIFGNKKLHMGANGKSRGTAVQTVHYRAITVHTMPLPCHYRAWLTEFRAITVQGLPCSAVHSRALAAVPSGHCKNRDDETLVKDKNSETYLVVKSG